MERMCGIVGEMGEPKLSVHVYKDTISTKE